MGVADTAHIDKVFMMEVLCSAAVTADKEIVELTHYLIAVEAMRATLEKECGADDPNVILAINLSESIREKMLNLLDLPFDRYKVPLRDAVILMVNLAKDTLIKGDFYYDLQVEWSESGKPKVSEPVPTNASSPLSRFPEPYKYESEESYLRRMAETAQKKYREPERMERPFQVDRRALGWAFDNHLRGVRYEDIAERTEKSVDTIRKDVQSLRDSVGWKRKPGRPKRVKLES